MLLLTRILIIIVVLALPVATRADRYSVLVPDVILPKELEVDRLKYSYLLRDEFSAHGVLNSVNRTSTQKILQKDNEKGVTLSRKWERQMDEMTDIVFLNEIDFGLVSEVAPLKNGGYRLNVILLNHTGPLVIDNEETVKSVVELEEALRATVYRILSKLSFDASSVSDEPDVDEMIFIPGGEAIIGSFSGDTEEAPERSVYVSGFYFDKYEVTNYQYKKFVDSTGGKQPVNVVNSSYTVWKDNAYPPEKKLHPVVNVTWFQAKSYCEWAGKRLPSAAEWEKAARGPAGNIYPWGNEYFEGYANLYQKGISYEKQQTVPIGTYTKSRSYYGILDLAGNAWEWTNDNFTLKNSAIQRETRKICKGGGWGFNGNKYNSRASFMMPFTPDYTSNCLGFRCAK